MRLALLLSLACAAWASAAEKGARDFLKKPDAWYASADAKQTGAIILSYQADSGGWPKNTDTVTKPYTGKRASLQATFDNGATLDELRFLARMFHATKDEAYRQAFDKGLAHVLVAQYPHGGWPQYYPLSKQYHRHVTFNDNSMVRILEFVREVSRDARYAFVDPKQREACQKAFDKGIACILKCQIVVDGKTTVWCAQHDAQTLLPTQARSYELASFSGSESVGITRLLMSIEKPSPEIKAAIAGAIQWFEQRKVTGIRIETVADPKSPKGKDRIVVKDPKAPALWARFYDLKSGQPYFCDRDGIPKPALADIGYERRNGYSWYGAYARDLLEQDYPKWKQANP
jgi:PelA/Pel-15E family pectate lyase